MSYWLHCRVQSNKKIDYVGDIISSDPFVGICSFIWYIYGSMCWVTYSSPNMQHSVISSVKSSLIVLTMVSCPLSRLVINDTENKKLNNLQGTKKSAMVIRFIRIKFTQTNCYSRILTLDFEQYYRPILQYRIEEYVIIPLIFDIYL